MRVKNITAIDLRDRDLVQLYCAFRIFNHEMELTLSTRENPQLRENLIPLGVTTMSAGSKTNPGGYTNSDDSLAQFEISDERSPAEIASMLTAKGFDPVWKDWDSSYDSDPPSLSEAISHNSALQNKDQAKVLEVK